MTDHSAEKDVGLRERILAIIGWFEEVPAKARAHDGTLVGHYVEASDWRAIRSELSQIANALRPSPSAPIRLGSCCVNVGTDACVCENPTNWGTPIPPGKEDK